MTKKFWIGLAGLFLLTLTSVGCGKEATSAVEDAEQSAIDAYKADQKADLEAMDGSLGEL